MARRGRPGRSIRRKYAIIATTCQRPCRDSCGIGYRERTDRYGRTLAYVYLLDGTLANAEIIRQGFGHAYTRFPFRYLDRFRALEREARNAARGLWAAPPADRQAPSDTPAQAVRWDDNGNGRISCAEARRHGIAPVRRGHPAYRYMRDGDGDGIVCE